MGAGDSGVGRAGLVRSYPAVRQSVAAIRADLARFASEWGAPSRIAEAAALAASEAATNVVMHAYRDSADPGQMEVTGALETDEMVITVRDAGTGLRPRIDSPGLGLGLAIIAKIVDRLDLRESPGGGVEVRMYFALSRHPST